MAVNPRAAEPEPQAQPVKPVEPPPVQSESSDLGLIIQEAGQSGHYIYTVVDRRTGKIVSQLPREELLRMRDQPNYAAGSVFDSKA